MSLEIANTIKAQLGHKALFMIGAKDLTGSANALSFRIGRNCKSVNAIKITLEPSDTYTVEFLYVTKRGIKVRAKCEDVYCDSLHATIESHTGLYTSLGSLGGR
jgi:hypothetical protein